MENSPELKTGISTLVDEQEPFERLVEKIAAAGFSHVSLGPRAELSRYHCPAGCDALAGLLEKNKLELNYIHAPIQYWLDLTSLQPNTRRAAIDSVKLSIDACIELNGNSVVAHLVNEPEIDIDEFEKRLYAGTESLKELHEYAENESVELCIENLPGDCHSRHRLTMELMHSLHLPDLYYCLDTCHAWIGNEEPMALVRMMGGRISALHLSDTMGKNDSHLVPGDGKVDFSAVTHELAKANFTGVVDLECSLSMLRTRASQKQMHQGDPVPTSIENYLENCHAAAIRIAGDIEEQRK